MSGDYPYEPLIDTSDPQVMLARVMACNIARSRGNFWLPCPLCGLEFGGQEWMHGNPHHVSAIRLPDDEPGIGTGICPFCTMAGRGDEWETAHPRIA